VGERRQNAKFRIFYRNPGVKKIHSDPTKVSEIIELLFGDNFFEMLSKESNLYYFQNQGNYDSSLRCWNGWCQCCLCNSQKKRNETRYIGAWITQSI
jgi:hypothetical protein